MKKILSIFCGTIFMLTMSVTLALACGCGKAGNSCSSGSCGGQCSAGCQHEESVCSEKSRDVKNVVSNTLCPVSGEPIGSMGKGVNVTHNGKTYQLCCAGCIEKFKVDPEKYVQRVK